MKGTWRQELVNRPVLVTFLGLAVGLSSGFQASNALFGLLLLPLLWRHWTMVAFASALTLGVLVRPLPVPAVRVDGGVFEGQAHVLEVPVHDRNFLRTVVQSDGRRYRLRLPLDSDVNLGDTVRLRALVRPLPERAIRGRLEVASLEPMTPVERVVPGPGIWQASMAARRSFIGFVSSHADTRLTGLLQALCFNVGGDLGDTLYADLKTTGTVHVISASGLHVVIVGLTVAWLLSRVPLPRWAQLALLAALLGLYAAATGLHSPMVRSVVMVLVTSSALLFRREPDGLSALAASGVANLLWIPEDVADVGFQLSYLAVAGLILFGSPKFMWKPNGIASWAGACLASVGWTSLVASVAVTPLIAHTFGQVSVVSVIANVLIVPVVPLVMVGCLVAWLCSGVLLPVAVGLLKTAIEPLAAWIVAVVESLADVPVASFAVPPFSTYWLIPAYILMAMLYSRSRRPAEETGLW